MVRDDLAPRVHLLHHLLGEDAAEQEVRVFRDGLDMFFLRGEVFVPHVVVRRIVLVEDLRAGGGEAAA